MLAALKAVESGTGINKAAREHGVPATTLKDRVPYSGLFSWGANFRYFRGSSACHENFHPRKYPGRLLIS